MCRLIVISTFLLVNLIKWTEKQQSADKVQGNERKQKIIHNVIRYCKKRDFSFSLLCLFLLAVLHTLIDLSCGCDLTQENLTKKKLFIEFVTCVRLTSLSFFPSFRALRENQFIWKVCVICRRGYCCCCCFCYCIDKIKMRFLWP